MRDEVVQEVVSGDVSRNYCSGLGRRAMPMIHRQATEQRKRERLRASHRITSIDVWINRSHRTDGTGREGKAINNRPKPHAGSSSQADTFPRSTQVRAAVRWRRGRETERERERDGGKESNEDER